MAYNPNNINGKAAAANSAPVVLSNDPTATGSLAALNATVELVTDGLSSASIDISGTWVGTITFQGTTDNTTWQNVNAIIPATTVPGVTTTANGVFRLTPGGLQKIRAIMTAFTSGTATITARGSLATGGIFVNQVLPILQIDLFTVATNITTQNLVPAGVATANSAVLSPSLNGAGGGAVQVTGTYTGALSLQATLDGVNWVTLGGACFLNVNTGVQSATIPSAAVGIYQVDVAGFKQIRITGLAAMTGTATVSLQISNSPNSLAIDAALPTGTNSIGNLGTVTTVTTLSNGQTAHSAASTGSPIRIAGRVKTVVDTTLVAGDASDIATTTDQAMIVKPFAVPELDWSSASSASGIVNTADVVLAAAAGPSIRRYITSMTVQNASATVSTEVVLKDGATIIWRGFVGAQTLLNSVVGVTFASPLKTTANAALNFACITTGAAVYVNAQGFNGV